jgi:hypothetical protein
MDKQKKGFVAALGNADEASNIKKNSWRKFKQNEVDSSRLSRCILLVHRSHGCFRRGYCLCSNQWGHCCHDHSVCRDCILNMR